MILLEKPTVILKSSKGDEKEIEIFTEKIFINTGIVFGVHFGLRVIFLIMAVTCPAFLLALTTIREGFFAPHTCVYFLIFYCFILSVLTLKGNLIDFHKKKIYFSCLKVPVWPRKSFSDIGGLDKVYLAGTKKDRYFFKLWYKGRRFMRGIKISSIHSDREPFEETFRKIVLPKLSTDLCICDNKESDCYRKTSNIIKRDAFLSGGFTYDKDLKIFYQHGIRIMTNVLTMFVLASLIPFTLFLIDTPFIFVVLSMLFPLVMSCDLYRVSTRKYFYLFETPNGFYCHIVDAKASFPVAYIKRIVTELVFYRLSDEMTVSIELTNMRGYVLAEFSSIELSKVDGFINNLLNIIKREIPIQILESE